MKESGKWAFLCSFIPNVFPIFAWLRSDGLAALLLGSLISGALINEWLNSERRSYT